MTAVQQLNRDTARGGSRTQGTTGSSNDKKEYSDKKDSSDKKESTDKKE
jgi:hypothetical protein